ncbi:hypothetical protein LSH36_979g02065 [Paralvinella palmiformis]|uniref:Tetraspanin n=1 Tax=Paralvinella palmiformis TaxID=53620 RepID=A0AAD9MS93_9ANNE|nr:hypothetical protein LSH36_979g02065 [Paralvinella palmiformis]
MVSSLRPHDNKKMEDSYYGNSNLTDIIHPRRYRSSKVDRLKFILVVLNTLLFISGSVTLGFSVYGLIEYQVLGYTELFKSVLLATIIPWIAAISGTLSVTMTPLCGCHGAVAERRNLLVLYFLFLLVMFLSDLVMCIWVISTADKIQKEIEASIRTAVVTYHQNPAIRTALDDLQKHLVCCGSEYGVLDYGLSGPPLSCVHESLFTPCIEKMRQLYKDYWLITVGAFGAMGVVLVTTMVLVIMLLGIIGTRYRTRSRLQDRVGSQGGVAICQTLAPPPPPPPLPPPALATSAHGSRASGSQSGMLRLANDRNQTSVV